MILLTYTHQQATMLISLLIILERFIFKLDMKIGNFTGLSLQYSQQQWQELSYRFIRRNGSSRMKAIKCDLKREKRHRSILLVRQILKLEKRKCLMKNLCFKIGFWNKRTILDKFYQTMTVSLEWELFWLKTLDFYQKILKSTNKVF